MHVLHTNSIQHCFLDPLFLSSSTMPGHRPSKIPKNVKKSKIFDFFQKSYFGPKPIKTHFLDTFEAPKGMPHPYIATNTPQQHHQTRKIRKNVKKSKFFVFFQKSYFGPKSIKTHFLDTLKAQKGDAAPPDSEKSGKM